MASHKNTYHIYIVVEQRKKYDTYYFKIVSTLPYLKQAFGGSSRDSISAVTYVHTNLYYLSLNNLLLIPIFFLEITNRGG